MTKIKITTLHVGKNEDPLALPCFTGGRVKQYKHQGKQTTVICKNMDESHKHYAALKETSYTKVHIVRFHLYKVLYQAK